MRTTSVLRTLCTVVTFVLAAAAGALAPAPAARAAESCPNESLRAIGPAIPTTHEPYSAALPDCRAYEQVSPVDKNLSDAQGGNSSVESSRSGEGVTFSSIVPFPGVPGAGNFLTYLATRGAGGWSTQGLLPESDPGSFSSVRGLSEDMALAVVEGQQPLLAPGATPGQQNFYLHDDTTGSYQLLAPGPGELYFDGASLDDSRILFEDTAEELISGVHDATGAPYLYEWHDGHLSLGGVLPDGSVPAKGASAGPGGPAIPGYPFMHGGSEGQFYTQDTISEDGSRLFFSDVETGQIYVREYGAMTVQVSASQRSVPDPVGTKPAYWQAATPDGRYVFFTSEEKLTNDSTASSAGPDLYRFDVESEALEDLTPGAPGGADVLGTLGVSDNGSYVYFAATAALASGATETPGQANLYEWHEGVPTFITRLSANQDEQDWIGYVTGEPGPDSGSKDSRVTPDGKTVLFFSGSSLNLYSASSPSAPVVLASGAYLMREELFGVSGRNAYLTRNLSEDGSRVFFQTEEALLPQDTNKQMDVYEWERAGEGSCERTSESFNEGTGGCYYPISTGQSAGPSYFGEANANGDNVFFFTRQSLVGQDTDEDADIYDARVDGGIASQNPPVPSAPCTGEACLGAPGLAPVSGASATDTTSSGSGNLTPTLTPPLVSKPGAKPLTRAQELAKALKACKKAKSKKKRATCEKRVRKQYAPVKKKGEGKR